MPNNEVNEEEIAKEEKRRQKSIQDQKIGSFYGAYREKHNQKDVDAIKNREGKNESVKRNEDEDETKSSEKSSSLEEKEGLNNEEKSEVNNKDSKEETEKGKENSKSTDKNKKTNPKQLLEDASGLTSIKNKFLALALKVKIALIAVAVLGGLFLIFIVISYFIMTIDNFVSGIVNFFGIPESDTKEDATLSEADGLYTNQEYFYDENGNELNSEDLVKNLKDNNNCKITFWNSITDTLNGSKFKDPCEFMRYVERHTKDKETDVGLIISTVFYGFDSQPFADQYDNSKDALNNISASNHYEAFKEILTNNKNFINENSLNTIIDNTISNGEYTYYTWEVGEPDKKDNDTEETDLDELETEEEPKKLVGKCEPHSSGSNHYSQEKWKIFMRFGERLSNMYDQVQKDSMAYNSSDEECNGSISDDELLNRVKAAANDDNVEVELDTSSINEARNKLKNVSSSLDAFSQAADIDSKTKDTFQSYNGEKFDYRNGFAYNNFPYFKTMSDNSDGINVQYDEIYTPKQIETIILEIIDRKGDLNDVLLLSDLDDNGLSYADNMTSVVTGASCGNYLSVKSLDDIIVRLTDCNGMFLANVPFDDYIIGVANAEVSNTNDNYVLSEMVAAISYSLKRHNNYTKGNVINMRSGTCDQAYCNMNKGCSVVPAPNVCSACSSFLIGGNSKAYPSLYPKYKALYEKASDYLLVSNGTVHNAHYVSSIQNEWSRKANAGMSFTQIMQETYADEGAELIRCSEADATSNSSTPSSSRVGNKATSEYPEVSPDYGEYYGFSYNDEPEGRNITMNPEWKKANLTSVSTNCSEAGWNQTMTVNVKAKSKFEDAFKRTCTILTDGVKLKNGKVCKLTANHITFGGSFVERKTSSGSFSLHAYGMAVDFNYTSKYNINGVTYSPYDSSRSLENYMKFVEALGGDEEDCRNINYILWKYAFEPAGFNWGGNWGRNGNSATYDGMHFEVKY